MEFAAKSFFPESSRITNSSQTRRGDHTQRFASVGKRLPKLNSTFQTTRGTVPKLNLQKLGRNDSEEEGLGFGNRHNSVGPRVAQPIALNALKIATERTKTHFKGAGDYMAAQNNSKGPGFKTSSMRDDKDLVVAGLLDEHAVKKKYAALVREQDDIVKMQGTLYA